MCTAKCIVGDKWIVCEGNRLPAHVCCRYISNFKFMDETGGIYMTCFDDECQRLLALSADDLFTLEMEGKVAEFKDAWKKTLFTTHIIKVHFLLSYRTCACAHAHIPAIHICKMRSAHNLFI